MRGDVAIVGAGMAGAACAAALGRAGRRVTLFDKGRSVGGRLAQRRIPEGTFDHGAQFVNVRDPAFGAEVRAWVAAGIVAQWPEAAGHGLVPFIGVPAMNAPVKALLTGQTVQTGCRIVWLAQAANGFRLIDDAGQHFGPFAQVVLAIPAPQAVELLATAGAERLAQDVATVVMAPCWAGLLAMATPLSGLPEVIRPVAGELVWAARHRTKPGRGMAETWTVHAGPDWSRANLDRSAAAIADDLLHRFTALAKLPAEPPLAIVAHRWRYALVEQPLGQPFLLDRRIGVCGDWCLGPRVEAAFLSGQALGVAMAG